MWILFFINHEMRNPFLNNKDYQNSMESKANFLRGSCNMSTAKKAGACMVLRDWQIDDMKVEVEFSKVTHTHKKMIYHWFRSVKGLKHPCPKFLYTLHIIYTNPKTMHGKIQVLFGWYASLLGIWYVTFMREKGSFAAITCDHQDFHIQTFHRYQSGC